MSSAAPGLEKKAVLGDELWVIAGEEGNEQAADFIIEMVKLIRWVRCDFCFRYPEHP